MRGSIVRRCRVCKKNLKKDAPTCHPKAVMYSIVYLIGTKQVWKQIGPNKKEAERKLAETVSEINNGSYFQSSNMAFRDFAKEWYSRYAEGRIKPSTLSAYRSMIKNSFNRLIGDYPLSLLTSVVIEDMLAKLRKQIKAKTINNHLVLLKTMLKCARKWKYIRENPVEEIAKDKVNSKIMGYLEPDDIAKLLNVAQEPFKTLLMVAIFTGMRRGEILALQWGDIDWNRNAIVVQRSLSWDKKKKSENSKCWRFITPKTTNSFRHIKMTPQLRDALTYHELKCKENEYDLLFSNTHGNPLDPDNMIKRDFQPCLKLAGIRKIRFHDLRHTFTTMLIHQNFNWKYIQKQLGHASIQTTFDRYGHLYEDADTHKLHELDMLVFGEKTDSETSEQGHRQINVA